MNTTTNQASGVAEPDDERAEEIEAVIACLGDDAAALRDENPEDERAANMDRAAELLAALATQPAAEPVAWQFCKRAIEGAPWGAWTTCTKADHDAIQAKSVHWGMDHQSRALYAAPLVQPAAPAEVVADLEFDDYPVFNEEAMGCGLEDRGITDRYEAMRYGWEEALERVEERITSFLDNLNPAALASPAQAPAALLIGGDPAEPKDDNDRGYTKPIGYLPAYELGRLHSGHDANLRSAKFGPSPLDGDVPVYLCAQAPAATEAPSTPTQAPSTGADEDLDTKPIAWLTPDLRRMVPNLRMEQVRQGGSAVIMKGLAEYTVPAFRRRGDVVPPRSTTITLDFKQATELLDMFGGEPTEITLMAGDGHSGEGLYAVYSADPEGAIYLGKTDEDATPVQPASPAVEVANDARCECGEFPGNECRKCCPTAPAAVTEPASERPVAFHVSRPECRGGRWLVRAEYDSQMDAIAAEDWLIGMASPAATLPGSLTDEQILKAGYGMQFRPWGIGSRACDAIDFARAVLALATTSTAAQPGEAS